MNEDTTNILQTADEEGLREFKTPWPKTIDELQAIISAVTNRPHDYGTRVYAMSIAAEATFNYVAATLGCTGFQASCADLDIIRRTRLLSAPFAIIDGNDLLYPQYDIEAKVRELLYKWEPWAIAEAKKKLETVDQCHPNVKDHWQELASRPIAKESVI